MAMGFAWKTDTSFIAIAELQYIIHTPSMEIHPKDHQETKRERERKNREITEEIRGEEEPGF